MAGWSGSRTTCALTCRIEVGMQVVAETDIRASFRACSAGERKRMRLPNLSEVEWENLDFLSWIDRSDPKTGYIVAMLADEREVGLVLRMVKATKSVARQSMCNWCRTIHPMGGVALFSTLRWNEQGKLGGTIGDYICADLACSAYVRRLKRSDQVQLPTMKSIEERIRDLNDHVELFINRVISEK